jgi:hypothetical protein
LPRTTARSHPGGEQLAQGVEDGAIALGEGVEVATA